MLEPTPGRVAGPSGAGWESIFFRKLKPQYRFFNTVDKITRLFRRFPPGANLPPQNQLHYSQCVGEERTLARALYGH